MRKSLLLSFLLLSLFCISQLKAQDSSRRKYAHFVGLQANPLIRQVINFGNSGAVNTPYLLTYSIMNKRSRWGLDAGLGYTYTNSFENDGNVKRDNYINELYFRLGVQHLLPINRRFSAQMNLHVLLDLLNNKTKVAQSFNQQTTTLNTKSDVFRVGLGPALGLRYRVSNRILLGTEATYYFKKGKRKATSTTETIFNGFPSPPQFETSSSNDDLTNFALNLPTAIFLILRF